MFSPIAWKRHKQSCPSLFRLVDNRIYQFNDTSTYECFQSKRKNGCYIYIRRSPFVATKQRNVCYALLFSYFLCIGLPPSESVTINNIVTHHRGPVRRRDPCSGRSWQPDRRTTSRVGSMYRRQPGTYGNTTVL